MTPPLDIPKQRRPCALRHYYALGDMDEKRAAAERLARSDRIDPRDAQLHGGHKAGAGMET